MNKKGLLSETVELKVREFIKKSSISDSQIENKDYFLDYICEGIRLTKIRFYLDKDINIRIQVSTPQTNKWFTIQRKVFDKSSLELGIDIYNKLKADPKFNIKDVTIIKFKLMF